MTADRFQAWRDIEVDDAAYHDDRLVFAGWAIAFAATLVAGVLGWGLLSVVGNETVLGPVAGFAVPVVTFVLLGFIRRRRTRRGGRSWVRRFVWVASLFGGFLVYTVVTSAHLTGAQYLYRLERVHVPPGYTTVSVQADRGRLCTPVCPQLVATYRTPPGTSQQAAAHPLALAFEQAGWHPDPRDETNLYDGRVQALLDSRADGTVVVTMRESDGGGSGSAGSGGGKG